MNPDSTQHSLKKKKKEAKSCQDINVASINKNNKKGGKRWCWAHNTEVEYFKYEI